MRMPVDMSLNISRKVILSVAGIILVYTLIVFLFLRIIVYPSFTLIERDEVTRDLARARNALDREILAVDTYSVDYSNWDDTYSYVANRNHAYIESNYDPSFMKQQNIDVVIIFDLHGRIVYGTAYNHDTRDEIILEDMNREGSPLKEVMRMGLENPSVKQKGLIPTARGWLLAGINPVVDSRNTLPPRGRLLSGRFVTEGEVKRIRELLEVDCSISPLENFAGEKGGRNIIERLMKGNGPVYVEEGNTLHTHRLLSDISGRIIGVLSIARSMEITSQGGTTVRAMIVILVIFGALILGASVISLKLAILNPVADLTERAASLAEDPAQGTRLPEDRTDEIATLARSFNKVLDRLYDMNHTLESRVGERTRELEMSNRDLFLMGQVFQNSLDGIMITDSDTRIIMVNPSFARITGFSDDDVMGKKPGVLSSGKHDTAFYVEMWKSIKESDHWSGEIWNRHKTGRLYPEWISISAIHDANGNLSHYMGVFHDISDAKQQEMFIRYQAFHDALTGLPNRLLLSDRMEKAIERCERNGSCFAVLFLDLDNFKTVNDSLGHDFGDLLLQHAAERLVRLVRTTDTVSRLGGDEFLIMMEEMKGENDAAILSERIIASFRDPFVIKDQVFHVGISIGIALYPSDGVETGILIRNADTAMYRAKEDGKHTFTHFTASLNERVARRFKLEADLRMAMDMHQLEVHYQPKMKMADGSIVGAEGLVRWRHFDSIISPMEFIPLAEETGLILSLDRMVFDMACTEISVLNRNRDIPLRLALNCSARGIQMKNYPDELAAILARTGMKPEWIEIEITETHVMKDLDSSLEVLERLSAMGMTIAMDDFGTGYSSLGQITSLPINTLKIDRSFVTGIGKSVQSLNIIETIIAMAQKLDLEVVAEGVETDEQYRVLSELGCQLIQGYLVSRPLEFSRFVDFINR